MRLGTGSIYASIVIHSVWNAVILNAFHPVATGPAAALWTGESGIFTLIVLVVISVLISRRGSWTYIRSLPQRGVLLSPYLSQQHPAPRVT